MFSISCMHILILYCSCTLRSNFLYKSSQIGNYEIWCLKFSLLKECKFVLKKINILVEYFFKIEREIVLFGGFFKDLERLPKITSSKKRRRN